MDKFEFKGTPGDWSKKTESKAGNNSVFIYSERDGAVCQILDYDRSPEEHEANAQLLASAPDTAFKLFKVNDLIKKYTSGKMDEEEFKNLLLGVTKANDIHLEKILK